MAVHRFLGPGVPRWFHEGYAQLASSSWSGDQAWQLRFAILAGRLSSLDSLSLGLLRGRSQAEHSYLLGYTAVEYLQRLGGTEGFASLLRRWREQGDLDRALRSTYGITLGQFERLWRRDVGDRYGWLLVMSQAVVFWSALAILLVVLGYLKKRRNRRKLAELDASVREVPMFGPPETPDPPGEEPIGDD